MAVTKEEGGRLNAFAKEPKIEVIETKASASNRSWLIVTLGLLLLTSLIAVTLRLS